MFTRQHQYHLLTWLQGWVNWWEPGIVKVGHLSVDLMSLHTTRSPRFFHHNYLHTASKTVGGNGLGMKLEWRYNKSQKG